MPRLTVTVRLGERSYPVHIGRGVLASLPSILRSHRIPEQIVLITDSTVARLLLRPLSRVLTRSGFSPTVVTVPPGEDRKSLATAERIYGRMLRARIGRSAAILAVGGGVIGDLAGFVAATYHRGLPLVQVPTTLLAQVDSAIGGKTAVNHALGKNMIGAFHQPRCVVADIDVLKTLPRREVLCGMGEIVKYGIILDPDLFAQLEDRWEDLLSLKALTVLHAVNRCATLKARLVSRDERESGARIILNCGHTIGHALEAAGNYRRFKHGEAVLLGLLAESTIANRMRILPTPSYERIVALICRLPINVPMEGISRRAIASLITRDKKTRSGKNRFVLPADIGSTRVIEGVPPSLIQASIKEMFAVLRTSPGN